MSPWEWAQRPINYDVDMCARTLEILGGPAASILESNILYLSCIISLSVWRADPMGFVGNSRRLSALPQP